MPVIGRPRLWALAFGLVLAQAALAAVVLATSWGGAPRGLLVLLILIAAANGLCTGMVRAGLSVIAVAAIGVVVSWPFVIPSCPLHLDAAPHTPVTSAAVHRPPGAAAIAVAGRVVALSGSRGGGEGSGADGPGPCTYAGEQPSKGETVGWSVLIWLATLIPTLIGGAIGDAVRLALWAAARRRRRLAAAAG
ncbi:MAG: hypothetical protein PGN13_05140 [Patulibacter minatonensis]